LAVVVSAAEVGVGRGRILLQNTSAEGSGVAFDKLMKLADEGESLD
jgi:hypothetical protein